MEKKTDELSLMRSLRGQLEKLSAKNAARVLQYLCSWNDDREKEDIEDRQRVLFPEEGD